MKTLTGAASGWLKKVPWGFRKMLNWIKNTYDNPEIFVTENGWSDTPQVGVEDEKRIGYYRDYINNLLKAVKVDGVNVKAYTAWRFVQFNDSNCQSKDNRKYLN